MCGKPGYSEPLEVCSRQSRVQCAVARHPPPSTPVARRNRSQAPRNPERPELAEHRAPALPLFQLESPQPAMDPAVQIRKDLGSICQLEVFLPAAQVHSQFPCDL